MEVKKLGIIGTGQMGRPMAENLLAAGYELTVYGRQRDVVSALVGLGATSADSPRKLASKSEAVVLSLPTPEAVKEVILGAEGLIHGLGRGGVVIDTSTIDPPTARTIHSELLGARLHSLDAPVSGGPEGAKARTLTFMVGGREAIFRKCLAIFRNLGRNIFYMGDPGSGQATKLVNQLLVSTHTLAAAEAVLYASSQGLDLEKMRRVIETSAGDSFIFRRAAPHMISREFGMGWQTANLHKDVGLILETSSSLSTALSTPRESFRVFGEAMARGLGKTDSASIIEVLRDRTGAVRKPPRRARSTRHAGKRKGATRT